jgi:hypothetical protein
MATCAGLDKVDANTLQAQRLLTEALWSTLHEEGLREGAAGRIQSFFFAESSEAVASLRKVFISDGWSFEVLSSEDDSGGLQVKLVSPEVALTLEAFLELAEVMLVAAAEHACTFDGFQLNLNAVRHRP